jgi:hypothetical protein
MILVIGVFFLTGCSVPPPEPTLAPLPTRIATTTLTPAPSAEPSATPAETSVPAPPEPTATLTAVPGTPVAEFPTAVTTPEGQPPVVVTPNLVRVTFSEAQLNATLSRRFEAAPLPGYTSAPSATLGDGALDLTLRIVPAGIITGTAAGAVSAQTLTLTVTLAVYNEELESQPTRLEPLNVGVTTRQVKPGEALLLQVLNDAAGQAAGITGTPLFRSVEIRQEGLTLIVVGKLS